MRLVLLCIALASMTVGSAVAYLFHSGGSVKNTLQAAKATHPKIVEEMNGQVKTDVKVDVGDPGYAVYVRAAIVVTWKDAHGNVLAEKPVQGEDYLLQMSDTGWFESGGFWYCETMVNSGGESPELIERCEQLKTKGEYRLSVDIITQTVQALGKTDDGEIPAVQNAWGIEVSTEGRLIDPT